MTKHFIDLEPHLGSCDYIWDDFVYEINHYPYKTEQGFITVHSHKPSYKYLMRQYLRHEQNKESEGRTYNSAEFETLKMAWTPEWDGFVKDTRITLVEQRETADRSFMRGNYLEDRLEFFPKTWAYLNSLPIREHYRTVLINGTPGNGLPIHKDWDNQADPCSLEQMHMLFVNPMNNRPFYYMDGERKVFTNTSLFMLNNAQLPHGVLAENHRTCLIRIYCALEDDFCDKLGIYKVKT